MFPLLLLGCVAPDPTAAADLLGAAGPIAYAAQMSSAAVWGESACATLRVACVSDPCVTEVDVTVSDTCPLPVAPEATGTIRVAGSWDSGGTALLAATFDDVDAAGHTLRVRAISAFTATTDEAGTTVAYVLEDVTIDGADTEEPEVGVEQTGLAVTVEHAGTAGDPTDDTYTVSGGGQLVAGTDVVQVALVDVVFAPTCRKNAVSGLATVEDVSEGGGLTGWTFHPACDGEADIEASVGYSAAYSQQSRPFPLVD